MKWTITHKLEQKIFQYLDDLDLVTLTFFHGIEQYLKEKQEDFKRKKDEVQDRESQLDELRKEIEWELYSKMLIPESRGDILELLENLDEIADMEERVIMRFYAEQPRLPKELLPLLDEMMGPCKKAVEEVISAARGFFRNSQEVRDKLKRIGFYEHEADLKEEDIKVALFQREDLDLAHKMHIRDFIDKLARLADLAEDIGDKISIYSVKREI